MFKPHRPPIRFDSPNATPENAATFIMLHGYGDEGEGWTNVAEQFRSANKLPHLTFLFPTAPMDQEDMTTAWFSASSFTQIRNPSTASTAWESSYDEPGMLSALSYVYSLIEAELERGVKLERIVVGGFSQGCVMSMLTGLGGRYKGRLGAVVGLSGALPPEGAVKKADEMAKDEGVSKKVADEGKGKDAMQIFLAHGTKDMLMPIRVFRSAVEKLEALDKERVDGEKRLESHVYEGIGHSTSGRELMDLCLFLERVVPP